MSCWTKWSISERLRYCSEWLNSVQARKSYRKSRQIGRSLCCCSCVKAFQRPELTYDASEEPSPPLRRSNSTDESNTTPSLVWRFQISKSMEWIVFYCFLWWSHNLGSEEIYWASGHSWVAKAHQSPLSQLVRLSSRRSRMEIAGLPA